MPVRRKTFHIRTNYGNDSLCASIAYTGHILNGMGSLFFLRLHEAVNLNIQIFDVDVEFIQMYQGLLHHPTLESAHHTIEVVYDLLFGGLEIMGDDLLFIHLIVFCLVDGFSSQEIFQDAAGTFAIDIGYGSRQLDVGSFQHLLEPVQLSGTFAYKAFAITD